MSPRRELSVAVGLCLLGSLLVLWGCTRVWVSYENGPDLAIEALRVHVQGQDVATASRALSVVGLAGVVAIAATRRWGRLVVGLLVLASGAGVVGDVIGALRDGLDSVVPRPGTGCVGVSCLPPSVDTTAVWAWLTLAGGVVLALSGLLVAVRGPRWAALSSSYDAPGAAPEPVTDKGVWDALDRGDDPTA